MPLWQNNPPGNAGYNPAAGNADWLYGNNGNGRSGLRFNNFDANETTRKWSWFYESPRVSFERNGYPPPTARRSAPCLTGENVDKQQSSIDSVNWEKRMVKRVDQYGMEGRGGYGYTTSSEFLARKPNFLAEMRQFCNAEDSHARGDHPNKEYINIHNAETSQPVTYGHRFVGYGYPGKNAAKKTSD
ncbi:uncharacterized protein LOC129594445 [Paramacrobiotus metropolitanus]|uniref:uncharacterized protein LOC129594445 n=1 Tax=Paramacrobiotus metropolitanus TaxID=2943436 RepID=UPI002445953E|nr:uncharacterized protein LOC129594445 [Paramacrobiotus metropolitanus]